MHLWTAIPVAIIGMDADETEAHLDTSAKMPIACFKTSRSMRVRHQSTRLASARCVHSFRWATGLTGRVNGALPIR